MKQEKIICDYCGYKFPDHESRCKFIEGNKLIAEFDGWQLANDDTLTYPNGYWYLDTEEGRSFLNGDFEYHSSWDWLMPVIEKISRIEYERYNEFNGIGMEIIIDTAYPRTFGMLNSQGKPMFRYNRSFIFEADTLIEAAWLATIDFIKRINENKSN